MLISHLAIWCLRYKSLATEKADNQATRNTYVIDRLQAYIHGQIWKKDKSPSHWLQFGPAGSFHV